MYVRPKRNKHLNKSKKSATALFEKNKLLRTAALENNKKRKLLFCCQIGER